MPVLTRRKTAVTADQAAWVRQFVGWTMGIRGVDFANLDDGEQHALFTLTQKAGTEHGADWSRLGRDRKKFERLVAKAAGLDEDAFEQARKDAVVLAEFATLAAEGRRRETLSREAETDWFRAMARHLGTYHLGVSHVAILTLLVAEFSSGETLGPRQRFEGSGDDLILVIDATYGLFGVDLDPDSRTADWRFIFEHLEDTGWLVVKRAGPEWRISLGAQMLRALRRTGPRPGVSKVSVTAAPRPEAA